ncbi:MAG: Transcriptional modulator of MazE/toxin, MazF [Caulobacteraceae bacterium]|nr:Transcriptional modulator of MazE/toxin, MazF [Caulobacteraceae bacterium]
MTTGSRAAGFRVAVRFQGQDGLILLDQMRALDKARLVRRLGDVPAATLNATLAVLREVFAD